MGEYDKIIKENIAAIFTPLLEKWLDLSIKHTIEIKDKLQTTLEREPDFLKKIIESDNREFILQLEFQTHDDPEMVYRMAEYKALLQRKYKMPVRQFTIHLGNQPPTMRTSLTPEEQITGFELRSIKELSTGEVLNSETPEEIILAILTDYPAVDAEKVIVRIINKLQRAATNETQLNRAIQQLLILSRLRNLETITKEKTDQMPIIYDITTDGLYLEGKEVGREEGNKDATDEVIIRALKLGKLTMEEIAEVANVEVAYVLQIQEKLENEA